MYRLLSHKVIIIANASNAIRVKDTITQKALISSIAVLIVRWGLPSDIVFETNRVAARTIDGKATATKKRLFVSDKGVPVCSAQIGTITFCDINKKRTVKRKIIVASSTL